MAHALCNRQYVVPKVRTLLVCGVVWCVCVCARARACVRAVKTWEVPFILAKSYVCPRRDPWKRLWTAKSCKGETRVPDAIIRTNRLRETTPTENPRSSKAAGVEHRASKLVL